jgi:hypothetical protein
MLSNYFVEVNISNTIHFKCCLPLKLTMILFLWWIKSKPRLQYISTVCDKAQGRLGFGGDVSNAAWQIIGKSV